MKTQQNIEARIFIIDDEASNLKLLDKLLRSLGYTQLILIQDSRKVLEIYKEERPDLILLDINMPQLNGYEVLHQLKSLDDPLMPPVVVLTAQAGREHLVRALASGARDFITKPFDRDELLMRVRNMLDAQLAHRLMHNQNEVLEEMVKIRTKALNQTKLQIIRRLGRAAEFKDNETGLHIIRMSQVSAVLAGCISGDEEYADLLMNASPMHDVGKIGIPDSVLLKPGKLDAEEWKIMKTHTTIGAEILSDDDSELLKTAHIIALTHHEKWDGSGYPEGLSGEDIPLSGRIVAVADVLDALTSKRSYKSAWPLDEAVDYICSNSGTHFDPEIIRHMQLCLSKIIKICSLYEET